MAEFLSPELVPLYEEYQNTLQDLPKAPVKIMYSEAAQLDKRENALKSMSADTPDEEKAERLEASGYRFITPEESALNNAGFVGTAAKLFSKYTKVQAGDIEPEEGFGRKLSILAVIPADQQKGATVTTDGYYYGGHFNPVNLENDS